MHARTTPSSGPTAARHSPPARRALSGPQRALHAAFTVTLVLVALGAIVVVSGWTLSRRAPGWWTSPDPSDPALIRRAEHVERFVTGELSKPRDEGAPYRLAIPEDAATAWINARLPRWLDNRGIAWPLEGTPILVRFRGDGTIVLAANVAGEGAHPQIVGAHARPAMSSRGPVLRLTDVSVGSLTLPPGVASPSIRRALPEDEHGAHERLIDALLRGRPLTDDPTWRVDGARAVTLVDLSVEDGRIVLTCVATREE